MIPTALLVLALVAQTASGVRTDCSVRGKATLIASTEELAQELRTAQKCRISSIRDKTVLRWYVEQGLLVPLADSDAADYEISPDLAEVDPDEPGLYLYARPWTRDFVLAAAAKARAEIGIRLRITSLVRSEDYQDRLREFNGYAARESTHPTGSTVDLALSDLTWRERNWLRSYVLELEKNGLVEATEERGNYCMHVFVHPAFTSQKEEEADAVEDLLNLPEKSVGGTSEPDVPSSPPAP